jgi:hypothetical protein
MGSFTKYCLQAFKFWGESRMKLGVENFRDFEQRWGWQVDLFGVDVIFKVTSSGGVADITTDVIQEHCRGCSPVCRVKFRSTRDKAAAY